ncbi:MAG: hypothetical protein ACJA08_001508 [Cyclobacteriaceae bacterium]|jgi:hypothetical protein
MKFILAIIFSWDITSYTNAQQDHRMTVSSNCSDEYINYLSEKPREIFRVLENPPYFGACTAFVSTKENSYESSDNNIRDFLIEKGLIDSEQDFTQELTVEFIVEKGGCLNKIKILKNTISRANEEIMSIIKDMHNWQPGFLNEKSVRVFRTLNVKSIADNR